MPAPAHESASAAVIEPNPTATVEKPATEPSEIAQPVIDGTAPEEWSFTAEVEPVDEVVVLTEVRGLVLEVKVKEGDKVSAGQVLLQIDSTTLEAQRAQALAALQAAQAEVELLKMEASEAEIEAARAAVTVAEAAYQRALRGPTEEEIAMARAQTYQAEAEVRRAQAAYDQLAWNPLIAALPESEQLQQATLALEAAQAHYNKLLQGADEDLIAEAYAQLAAARANLQRLEDGPAEAQILAAEAQVRQAETALYMAQLQLEKATVRAPIDGIVGDVNVAVGAMAQPDSPAVRLFSPDVKVVIPIAETHLAQLQIGVDALITVTAFPNQTFDATVTAIAPQVDPTTRTVRVTIEPDDEDTPLLPGMVATVELLPQ